ncbi:ISNCY family transposase [uncultured Thiodictyon sp.]|uniref:ISNCY family transposase n=1 Tax=uncultured Thiodictyon sp. TaxID=1846217 RepID=UPI0025F4B7D6|nr:ISNCY family transposase [uncultured Thiodictyon sp.]
MHPLEDMIQDLKRVCAGLEDKRQGQGYRYSMADIGLAAFSVFFMQSPSLLAHQRALQEGQGRSNGETLLGMTAIPCDNHIRTMLDGTNPAAFDGLFLNGLAALSQAGALASFQRLEGRLLVALDGTEHFCSRKIKCAACSQRKRSDGGTEYFHSFLGATVVAPGHAQVLQLPPEFITPQDGALKQDCERAAAKRWLAKHGPALAVYRPIYLGDDLFACQPNVEAILASGGSFILTCKSTSHKTIAEYLDGAELEEHRQAIRKNGKTSTITYRWLNQIPLRASKDALNVNWFSIEIRNAAGKRTYFNSFITDIEVFAGNVVELAACGRARWKIENETFNVLKTDGYNLEHNFGHGKVTLASVLVTLNLMAFAFHTIANLTVLAWREAVAARGATYEFFQHLRTITVYIVFPDWPTLLHTIAHPKARPPP